MYDILREIVKMLLKTKAKLKGGGIISKATPICLKLYISTRTVMRGPYVTS
jgi:hypothetical protein